MDYKQETTRAYDAYASEFEQRFYENFLKWGRNEADAFAAAVPGRKVLDLGSGPGVYAAYLRDKGFDVLCVDISEKMVGACRRKGLAAEVMDVEDLRLPPKSFDGVLASAVLLHVPAEKIPGVVEKIAGVLKQGGVLLASFREGEKQGFEESERYPGVKRFFTYLSEGKASALFEKRFELLRFDRETTVDGRNTFINYLLKLK